MRRSGGGRARALSACVIATLIACSSSTVIVDAGDDGSSGVDAGDATVKDTGAKDTGAKDTGVDSTIGDSGVDSTLGDSGGDATLADAADATISDASTTDASGDASGDASACGDAGAPDATLTTLASFNLGGAAQVAVDGTNVYFTSTIGFGSVLKCAIGGCNGAPTTIASGFVLEVSGIAVDSTNVYWTVWGAPDAGAGAIMTCPVGGCDGGPGTIAGSQNQPWFVTVDATNVYWTDYAAGTVMSCPKTGCTTPTTIASGEKSPLGIAVDSSYVYWGSIGDGTVKKCALGSCEDGGSPTTIFGPSGLEPVGIAVDGNGNLYVTHAYDTGAVIKLAPDGGGAALANQENGGAQYIATDGVNVYWTLYSTYPDNVRKCSVDGCCMNPTTIAPTQNNPTGIAVDGANVYFATFGSFPDGGAVTELTPK